MSAAVQLAKSQAVAVLEMRLKELSEVVQNSESRMSTESEDTEPPFQIRISECRTHEGGFDKTSSMVTDFGLAGENLLSGRDLATSIMGELCSSHYPMTAMALSESLSASRGRVVTIVDRMRAGGFVERVPMVSRLSQDIFSGIVRQRDARGEEWLMTRGGLGRLEETISASLVEASRKDLTIEKVSEILSPVSIKDQRILLNTLGGRMPYGIRIAGSDGAAVSESIQTSGSSTKKNFDGGREIGRSSVHSILIVLAHALRANEVVSWNTITLHTAPHSIQSEISLRTVFVLLIDSRNDTSTTACIRAKMDSCASGNRDIPTRLQGPFHAYTSYDAHLAFSS